MFSPVPTQRAQVPGPAVPRHPDSAGPSPLLCSESAAAKQEGRLQSGGKVARMGKTSGRLASGGSEQ